MSMVRETAETDALLLSGRCMRLPATAIRQLGALLQDYVRFGRESDVEPGSDSCHDGFGDGHDFRSGCPAEIDEDEGLLGIYSGVSHGFAFPAAFFNQPAGGEFYCAFACRIDGHIGMQFLQFFGFCGRYDGVCEKTACTADFFRVGKFGIPDADDGVADIR